MRCSGSPSGADDSNLGGVRNPSVQLRVAVNDRFVVRCQSRDLLTQFVDLLLQARHAVALPSQLPPQGHDGYGLQLQRVGFWCR